MKQILDNSREIRFWVYVPGRAASRGRGVCVLAVPGVSGTELGRAARADGGQCSNTSEDIRIRERKAGGAARAHRSESEEERSKVPSRAVGRYGGGDRTEVSRGWARRGEKYEEERAASAEAQAGLAGRNGMERQGKAV